MGHTYKKKVNILNASYERQKFVLEGLVDQNERVSPDICEINEVITVHYTALHSLPPGLSHDFELTFHPTMTADWTGHLNFNFEHGSFAIPVKCLQKRIVPVISPSVLHFIDIVPHTWSSLTATIKNEGMKTCVFLGVHQVDDHFEYDTDLEELLADVTTSSVDTFVKATNPSPKDGHNNNNAHHKQKTEHKRVKSKSNAPKKKKSAAPVKKFSQGITLKSERTSTIAEKTVRSIVDELVGKVADNIFIAFFKENDRTLPEGGTRHLQVHFRPGNERVYKTTFEILLSDNEKVFFFKSVPLWL